MAGEPTAAMTPAWANTETSFLGSDWSDGSGMGEPDEPRGRRGRRRSGRGGDDLLGATAGPGKARVALLSVAAVAVVLGGTVAGVKFMSTAGESGKCEGATCAAVQATGSQRAPAAPDPVVEETEPPIEEEPTEEVAETEPAETPTPTVSYNARAPRRTTSPTPTPSRTKEKKSAEPTEEPTEEPVDETATPTPTPEPSTLDDTDTGGQPSASSVPTESAGTFGSGGGSVNVRQSIQQRLTTYKADMTLSNTSAQTLQAPTISVPVDGRVVDVDGAGWTQDGDLLILDLPASLAAGESVKVSFTATGRGSKAQNCGLVAGECAVS
ncbi:hypothetical protein ACFQYP_62435 [Nonomuraea antimicrobica]